jgi:hypothetical protein
VTTSEPDFLHITNSVPAGRIFTLKNRKRFPMFPFSITLGHLARLHAELGIILCRSLIEIRAELGAMLVQGYRVSEEFDVRVGFGEGKPFFDDAYGSYSIPGKQRLNSVTLGTLGETLLPDTEELDLDIDREGFFERPTLRPTNLILSGVHMVRKWDLLVVRYRQQADLLKGRVTLTRNGD